MNRYLTLPYARIAAMCSNERDLLRRARQGERDALAVLLGRQREPVFRLCFHVLRETDAAEDAAQEVLLRALEKMPGFRAESEFSTWVYRIALNYCLELRRTTERRSALAPPEERVSTADFSGRVDTRLALENALDALPEAQRVALILQHWHGKSYAEIGAILGLSTNTVKSRLYEARQQLQRAWEAQNEG